ncbi:MAG: hypothetical protein ABEJ91_04435 [Candidatus Nanohaloarchaea archaeon]
MKPEKVFKRYDIRGDYPGEINEEFAERLGKALGTFARRNHGDEVVVGRDNKESSQPLKQAFIGGLESVGVNVLDAGTGPTDYVAFTGMENSSVSVQVTSSHLPLDTNGFKFMYPGGNGFLNPDLYEVQDIFREGEFEDGSSSSGEAARSSNLGENAAGGTDYVAAGARQGYLAAAKRYFGQHFDGIDRKVVVDTLGGASTEYLPHLMEQLGAEVVNIAGEREVKGPYLDPPKPEPENLGYLEERVEQENADVAVVNDMDADRVAVYYEGEWIPGDRLFALLAQLIEPADMVASIDTSQMVEEVVRENGGEIHYTRVGDPFVIDETLEQDAELSGEPNGHYCFPALVPYNSGTVAALLLAAMDIDSGLEELREYHSERADIEVEDNLEKESRMQQVEERVKSEYSVISDLDGVKFELGEGNVLVRPSGSSPVIRVIAEARDAEAAGEICSRAEELVRNP